MPKFDKSKLEKKGLSTEFPDVKKLPVKKVEPDPALIALNNALQQQNMLIEKIVTDKKKGLIESVKISERGKLKKFRVDLTRDGEGSIDSFLITELDYTQGLN